MNKPIIAVLINTYNHERFIEQAIVSVLEQDFPSDQVEIVIVDDGSTDNTPNIIRRTVDGTPGIRYIRKKNGGQASAFNAGISETHADLIAFLDGDDWWEDGKLSAVVEMFKENPQIGAVGHGFYDTLSDGRPSAQVVPKRVWYSRLDGSEEEMRAATVGKSFLATSKLTVRRRVLDRLGPIPDDLVFCADEPIMDAALALGGAILLDRPLAYYRYHSGNLFGFSSTDRDRNRKRYDVQKFLVKYLRELLPQFGVRREAIEVMVERYLIDMERFEAVYGGGGRWRTFRAESRYFRQEYRNASVGYLLFKTAVAGLTLLLPPARFYQLRGWYSGHNFRRIRESVGSADVAYPEVYTRTAVLQPGELIVAGDHVRVSDGKR